MFCILCWSSLKLLFSFDFNQHIDCMNSSRADSRVNCLKTADVSETHSISILRESRSLSLRKETECLSETLEIFKQFTRLSAREFIQFCRRESLETYVNIWMFQEMSLKIPNIRFHKKTLSEIRTKIRTDIISLMAAFYNCFADAPKEKYAVKKSCQDKQNNMPEDRSKASFPNIVCESNQCR
jgi:superfamily II helicase